VLVALAGGCGGGSPPIAEDDLPRIVLQPADIPSKLRRVDEGELTPADTPAGPRSADDRFGREGGWKARYQRTGNPTARTPGPAFVESRVDVFDGEDGAADDLQAYESEFDSLIASNPGAASRLPSPQLGDGAVAFTRGQSGLVPVRAFTIAWRYENVTASVTVSGFEGKVSGADALRFARKQQRRMAAAAND
jgi:hypothetical protein